MTLADAPRSADRVLPEGASPDDVVVHQQDVQARGQRAVGRRRRGDADHGPAGHRDQRRALRRQHADPAGPGLLPAVRRSPRSATPTGSTRRSTTAPQVAALPLLRRHLRARSTRPTPRPRPRCPATTARWTCCTPGRRRLIARPRSAASASCSSPPAWWCCCSCAYQLVWTNVEAHRAHRRVADDVRDAWERPPRARRPAGHRHGRPTSARASRSCTSRGSARTWSVPVVQGVALPDLARGVGHYPKTARPGEVGNFAVAGHRATNGEPFAYLDRVRKGRPGRRRDPGAAGSPTSSTAPRSSSPTSVWVLDPVPGQPGADADRAAAHPDHVQPALGVVRAADRLRSPAGDPARRPTDRPPRSSGRRGRA